MELKVASTLFNSNGGGGSNFFMGRGDRDEKGKQRKDEDETGEMDGDELAFSNRDGLRLPPRRASFLALGQPAPLAVEVDADAVVAELESAIQLKLRLITISVTRMEQAFDRRLRAEIGDVVVGA